MAIAESSLDQNLEAPLPTFQLDTSAQQASPPPAAIDPSDSLPDLDSININDFSAGGGSLLPGADERLATNSIAKAKAKMSSIQGSPWFMRQEDAKMYD